MSSAVPTLEGAVDPVGVGVLYPTDGVNSSDGTEDWKFSTLFRQKINLPIS